MTRTTNHAVSLLILAALVLTPLTPSQSETKPAPAAATGQKAQPTFLAVVDMERAALQTKAFKKGLVTFQKLRDDFAELGRKLIGELQELEVELDLLKPSPERDQKHLERQVLLARQKGTKDLFELELIRQKVANTKEIESELNAAVAELAAERGILVVLRMRTTLSIQDMVSRKLLLDRGTAAAKVRALQERDVVYTAPQLDLTDMVIKYLKK